MIDSFLLHMPLSALSLPPNEWRQYFYCLLLLMLYSHLSLSARENKPPNTSLCIHYREYFFQKSEIMLDFLAAKV